jgi:hypothetical protein
VLLVLSPTAVDKSGRGVDFSRGTV